MVNKSPPSASDNRTHEHLDNTSASHTSQYVHSTEPPSSCNIHQLPAVVGSQTGDPAAGNVDCPLVQHIEGCRLPLSGLLHDGEDLNAVPYYRGHLALTVIVPRNARFNEYIMTSIHQALVQSENGNHISFRVYFKRNPSILSVNDMMVARGYVDNFRFRSQLLAIYREVQHLKRIWFIDPDLITELPPSDQASTNAFMQNRSGLYLECRCGIHVYVGQCFETISNWTQCWDLHISRCTTTSHGIIIQDPDQQEFNE